MRRRPPQHFLRPLAYRRRRHPTPATARAQALLRDLVQPPMLYVDHVEARGVDLFHSACAMDLEGIVAKLATSAYDPDNLTWAKDPQSHILADGRAGVLRQATLGLAFRFIKATGRCLRRSEAGSKRCGSLPWPRFECCGDFQQFPKAGRPTQRKSWTSARAYAVAEGRSM